ncbi:unnamed protein product [Prunus brigantina]
MSLKFLLVVSLGVLVLTTCSFADHDYHKPPHKPSPLEAENCWRKMDMREYGRERDTPKIFYPNTPPNSTHGRPCWHARAQTAPHPKVGLRPPKGPRPPPKHRPPTPLDNEAAVPLKDVEASYKPPGKKPPHKPYKPPYKPPPSN